MEDVFYGISGLNLFQCVVGLKMENGFNFSMQEHPLMYHSLQGSLLVMLDYNL